MIKVVDCEQSLYFSFESRKLRACVGGTTPVSPPFTINLHNFTFSLAAPGNKGKKDDHLRSIKIYVSVITQGY